MPSPVNSADIAAKPSSLVIALDSSKRASFHIPSNRISVLTEAFERMLGGRNVLMDFQFANMCFTLPSQKVILRNVTGSIYARKMTAIMGPSGAGKTTFMNVLCGKVDRTSGTLRISGKVAEVHHFKKLIGYVPQEDIMLRELTVRQNMMHSARVRLPSSWSAEEVGKYVDDLLVALKLDHVKHSRIGDETLRGVSGGQRKRVNIGIELAAAPVCLFLDEPTSGLDSTAALDVCRILKEISVLGFTIVAVLHQPRIEIFNKFDEVLLLAEGGSTAYIGPVTDAQPYFEAMGFVFSKGINPADVLMDILSGKGITKNDAEISAADLVDKWQVYESSKHPVGGLAVSPSTSPSSVDFHTFAPALMKERGASWIMQFIYCHNRSVLQQIATPASFALEIFVGAVAGSVMGFAISSETKYSGLFILPLTALSPATVEWLMPQVGFISQLSCGLAAGPAAVKVFSEERTVFWREASAGHKSLPYFLGKVVASTYRILLSSLHFATCFHILANPIFSLGVTYAIILVSYLGVYGLATTVSMIVRRENGALLSVVVCLFYSVFSGYAINLRQARNWGIAWLFDQSFTRWAAEAMYSESITPYSHVYMTEISAAEWGYTLNRVPFDLGMAVVSGLVWRVIAYILMIALHRDKQR